MEYNFELLPPTMPNFIYLKLPPRPRGEGFKEGVNIDIVDLTEDQAIQYSELMRDSFMMHWRERRAKQKRGGY